MRPRPLIFVVLLLAAVPFLYGQSRQITLSELESLKANARDKGENLPVRVKTVETNPDGSTELISEDGRKGRYHYITIRKKNGVVTKEESIHIGAVRYKRRADGSWLQEPPGSGGSGSGSGDGSGSSGPPPESTMEYLFVGKEKINGRAANHYRKSHIVRYTSRTPVVTNRYVEDYWFGSDGLLVRQSYESSTDGSDRGYTSVTDYDFAAKFKIVAPKVRN